MNRTSFYKVKLWKIAIVSFIGAYSISLVTQYILGHYLGQSPLLINILTTIILVLGCNASLESTAATLVISKKCMTLTCIILFFYQRLPKGLLFCTPHPFFVFSSLPILGWYMYVLVDMLPPMS
jgi:hypothetical protein